MGGAVIAISIVVGEKDKKNQHLTKNVALTPNAPQYCHLMSPSLSAYI